VARVRAAHLHRRLRRHDSRAAIPPCSRRRWSAPRSRQRPGARRSSSASTASTRTRRMPNAWISAELDLQDRLRAHSTFWLWEEISSGHWGLFAGESYEPARARRADDGALAGLRPRGPRRGARARLRRGRQHAAPALQARATRRSSCSCRPRRFRRASPSAATGLRSGRRPTRERSGHLPLRSRARRARRRADASLLTR
jgi:hypothetical protein